MIKTNNENIIVLIEPPHTHARASEKYIHVILKYPTYSRDWWVPIEYRRTWLNLVEEEEISAHLEFVYDQMKPENIEKRLIGEKKYWDEEKANAWVTRPFFEVLKTWWRKCVECTLPQNPNWARRIQDLKEMWYTIATDTSKFCKKCNKKTTHLILLPIKRWTKEWNWYETWSPQLRQRILKLLDYFDVYEYTTNSHCLPDHKFSEIRWWKDTKWENPDTMTDEEIIQKFQLLTNQRNQQKREMCRQCYQTGKRWTIYWIPFFYEGNEYWDENIPKEWKEAEKWCIGCPWYDIKKWREKLIEKLNKDDSNFFDKILKRS